jgi:hypothetical protein
VVLADGRVVRASAGEQPDLFWALRGGGGNFGVVTEFEFRLLPVGPIVPFGLFFWTADRGREALRLCREISHDLPRTVSLFPAAGLTAPPAPFVPAEHVGATGFAVLVAGFGDPAEHAAVVDRIHAGLPPSFELVTPMPFTAVQQLLDEPNAWGFYHYEKSAYVAELSDEVIDVVLEGVAAKTSPLSIVLFYQLDGAFSDVGADDTAFGGDRRPRWGVFCVGSTPVPEMLPAAREWARGLHAALGEHAMSRGTYVNAVDIQDPGEVRDTYGAKFDRLAAVKATYDPDNVFHRNVNISSSPIPAPRH